MNDARVLVCPAGLINGFSIRHDLERDALLCDDVDDRDDATEPLRIIIIYSFLRSLYNHGAYTTGQHYLFHRLQRCQNFHPTFSLPSSGIRNLFCSFPLRLPTHANHITKPTTMNATTSSVCNGSANTALLNRKRLTQQKIMGVVIQVLYGRSRSGSRTRRMMRPSTV